MTKIMSGGDTNEDADHRYLLFSATFDKNMRKLAKKYLANDHVRIRIGRAGSSHMNVTQQVSILPQQPCTLLTLIRSSGWRGTQSSRLCTISWFRCHLLAPLSSSSPRRLPTSLMTSCSTTACPLPLSTLIALSASERMHCKSNGSSTRTLLMITVELSALARLPSWSLLVSRLVDWTSAMSCM